uniref:Uncharacterized protein n=1 Tax=Alexandrium monilatum TaxID=311494 RepID=A0A7S4UJY2_9DINO
MEPGAALQEGGSSSGEEEACVFDGLGSDPLHAALLCKEAMDHLMALGPDGLYVDCTFGAGGHSRAILARLSPHGRLLAMDVDGLAMARAQQLAASDGRLSVLRRRGCGCPH